MQTAVKSYHIEVHVASHQKMVIFVETTFMLMTARGQAEDLWVTVSTVLT